MSLKNLFISILSIVFILIVILVAVGTNPATMASPEGESLNSILVSTETINYHDTDALFEGKPFDDFPLILDSLYQ